MTGDDVLGDDMAHPKLSDEQLAAVIDAAAPELGDHPVAEFVGRVRSLSQEDAPTPVGAITEFLGVDHVVHPTTTGGADTIDVALAPVDNQRRSPVIAIISSFVATAAGKIVVGTTLVAASVAGAHVAGVVDVPGLPDDTPSIVDVADIDDDSDDSDDALDDDSDDLSTTSTTSPTETSTTTTISTNESTAASTSISPTSTTVPTTSSSTSTSTSSSTSTSTTTVPAPIADQTLAYTVADVGTSTVQVRDGVLQLVSTSPSAGWVVDEARTDATGVETRYEMDDVEVRIDFEIDDGLVRVRIRVRDRPADTETERFEYFDAAGNSLGDRGRNGG